MSYLLALGLLPVLLGAPLLGAQSADNHYREGKRLIQDNCDECANASMQALKNGIDQLQTAIKLGYSDKASAYKLLVQAYNSLALGYPRPSEQDRKQYLRARDQAFKSAIAIDPTDVDLRFRYAITIEDTRQQIMALREILKMAPKHADAHFALGVDLCKTGSLDEGISELKEAMSYADSRTVENYGNWLVTILEQHGRKEEADRVREELEKKKTP